jgi:hypothetical protein
MHGTNIKLNSEGIVWPLPIMVACRGMEIYLNVFFNTVSALDAGEWSVRFTPPSPYSLGEIRCHPFKRRLVALQGPTLRFHEEDYHAHFENRTMIPRLSSP